MSSGIQPSSGDHLRQGVVVCVHCEGMSIQVVPEFLSHCLFQGQKLQLVRWVVPLRFTESPTRITDDSFLSILILVQNCTAANHTSITVEFKQFVIVRVTQNRRRSQRFLSAFQTLLPVLGPKSTSCLLYTSPSPRDISGSRMPSSA